MQKRRLGQTNLEVSPIGLGTVKFGRNLGVKYPQPFTLPNDAAIKRLLDLAFELGVNLIDTAPAYGSSEERLGHIIRNTRNQWVICTKVGESFVNGQSYFDFSHHSILESIDRSLQRLQTDYLDLVLIHSNGEDENLICNYEVFVPLQAAKRAGKIRSYGMSSKTVVGGLLTVQHADVAMVTYNPTATEESVVIAKAHQLQKGILIKKGFLSGHLNKVTTETPVHTAMEFIFAQEGVSSLIVGTINPLHLQENVQYANEILG